ncbi:unnamed protein product, partial [Vitis vinifera]|uniref:Uncharacterized protein n=1 Tax=Vitis vinifera TaxID=29760 RepID=D7TYV7_VITVI
MFILKFNFFADMKTFSHLGMIDMSKNDFTRSIPPSIGILASLKFLDLSRNLFTANLSSSLIASFTSLQFMDLSNNRFTVHFCSAPKWPYPWVSLAPILNVLARAVGCQQ